LARIVMRGHSASEDARKRAYARASIEKTASFEEDGLPGQARQ
jgi:hypothetical protein